MATGVLALAGVIGLAACSTGPSGSSSASGADAGSSSGRTTTSSGPLVITPRHSSSTSQGAVTTAAAGLGSPVGAFASALGIDSGDSCAATSPCFGPGVVNGESGTTFEFTSVLVRDGLVLGYDQSFQSRTALAKAEAWVLRYLPADARQGPVTVDTVGGSCALFDVSSATLAATFAGHPSIGDASGIVGVKLSYTDDNDRVLYDPQNIQDAVVTVGPVNPSSPC